MRKALAVMLVLVFLVVMCGIIFFTAVPSGRVILNNWKHALRKADDSSMYQTKKMVEDTCRSMIASYESDVLVYQQYCDSDNSEKQLWAEQAKMRANKTASTYNNYILQNRYVWSGNVPPDIASDLSYVD